MVFWRKKNNASDSQKEKREERLLHHAGDPALEPPTEYDSAIDPDFQHTLDEGESEILEGLEETPVPAHTPVQDAVRKEKRKERREDESGGGWLSRLTKGLSKSSNKITEGLTDLITKRKLDEETLEKLEELLIEADLGPKTAARIVADFSEGRFGKEVEEHEIREALAGSIANILEPVAKPIIFERPANGGPFVVLVCGVNGVGKTTTIGKIAYNLHVHDHKTVMIAAADTFRAAAIEQLDIWAKRAHCKLIAKDIGADAAAVAFEAYEQAKKENVEVLLIDTAGRLQNKKNLMEELQKIVRVLRKQDEKLPHATLLVLDATTGQNAYSQLQAFKDMVDVTGLAVTKLDGSAKGGVLVGLADQFGVPVHVIGVGEAPEDMQPFGANEYARSLVGLETA